MAPQYDLDLFISYAREDEHAARRLYNDLRNSGLPIKPWFDKEDLLPGDDYDRKIRHMIKNCDFFIPLFSSNSVQKRGYIQREFKIAINTLEEIPPGSTFVIPVRLDECEIPYDQFKFHYQDLFPDWYDGLKKILASLRYSLEKIKENEDKNDNSMRSIFREDQEVENSSSTYYGIPRDMQQTIQTRFSLHFIGEKRIFVGREDYINEKIKNLFEKPGSRISIVGPGGSGKSQLAFKALHQYYENDKIIDLVIPVYFSATLSSTTIIDNDSTIHNSNTISFKKFLNDIGFYLIRTGLLQLKEQEFDHLPNETSQIKIKEAIAKIKHPVIYCDNFETLSSYIEENKNDKNARSIFNFLNNQLPPNVSVLVTSRNRKNLSEEHSIILEGLSIEEGISLFNKNASAYEDHLSDIKNTKIQHLLEKIVTKTGGHPLSVEILAKTYEGGGETELENILYTLGIERADLFASEERMQSLQNCFDYSIDKLNSNIQNLLPALTIFHSPFPADIVEKVFRKEAKDKSLLLELYNKSLLSRIQGDKYGSFSSDKFWLYTIHPALRNYLRDKYKVYFKQIEQELIPYFCNFYSSILNETYDAWGKKCHLDFLRRFEIISKVDDNDFDRSIMFALNSKGEQKVKQIGSSISVYLGHIYTSLGFYDDALNYYKKALTISESEKDQLGIARNLTYIGKVYRQKGLYNEALVYLNRSLAIQKNTNDGIGIASNYYRLGEVYRNKGLYDEALVYHKKALEIHKDLKDKSGMTRDYSSIGRVYRNKGLYDEALVYHKKALEINEELNDKAGMAVNYTRIGLVYSSKGFYDEALTFLLKALEISKDLKDKVGKAVNYGAIGVVYRYKGLYDEALAYHIKALAINEDLKATSRMAVNYNHIGGSYRDKGLYDKAMAYHEKSLAIDEELNDKVGMAVNYTNIGLVYEDKGLYEQAIDYVRKSIAIDEDLNDKVGLAVNYSRLGEVYRNKGLYDDAVAYHKKALVINEEVKSSWKMATNYSHIGVAYRCKGLYDEALGYHKKALEIFEATNDKVGLAVNYSRLGEVYRNKGLYDEALVYHKKALEIFELLNDKVNLPKIFYSLSLIYRKKNLEIESKEAMDNAKRMMSSFKKDTGYSHPFETRIESIVDINI